MHSVVICYSHKDESHLNELRSHLAGLQRQGVISTWHDRRIEHGLNLDDEIDQRIESAGIVLLLISSDFIASDYCYEREMTRALERNQEGSARVIPVILRPCDWEQLPFGRLKAVPKDGAAVTTYANRDAAYLEIAQAIREIVEAPKVPRADSSGKSCDSDGIARDRPSRSMGNIRIKRQITDYDRDKLLEGSFEFVKRFFESSLAQLESEHSGINTQFTLLDATSFEAIAYVGGERRAKCGIWIGDPIGFGNRGIYFSTQGADRRNSYNESITVQDDGYEMYLSPAGMSFFSEPQPSRVESIGAAEHLWNLFLRPLR